MKYLKGRDNLACTVFFPVKCGNNCPFCTSKQMYNGYKLEADYLMKIYDSIRIANECNDIKEFVLTGGEPLIDLKVLKHIISAMKKPVFINTSLPKVSNIDDCIDFINREQKIRGVNISQHFNNEYNVKTCDKDKIDAIKKYKRINCIIKPEYLEDEKRLFNFIEHFSDENTMINFRADYRTVTTDTLKNRDKIDEWLLKNYCYEHSANCLVCNSEFFSDDNETVICYHRGLEHSKVITKNYTYVNDVLIDIYGNIWSDWSMDDSEDVQKDFISWLKRDAKKSAKELTIAYNWNDRLIKNAFEEEFDKIVDKKKHKKAPKLNSTLWPSHYIEDKNYSYRDCGGRVYEYMSCGSGCGAGGCGPSPCRSGGCGAGGC